MNFYLTSNLLTIDNRLKKWNLSAEESICFKHKSEIFFFVYLKTSLFIFYEISSSKFFNNFSFLILLWIFFFGWTPVEWSVFYRSFLFTKDMLIDNYKKSFVCFYPTDWFRLIAISYQKKNQIIPNPENILPAEVITIFK